MNKNASLLTAASVLAFAALAGCGGGGDGSGLPPITVPSAQGAYQGTMSSGLQHNTIVLEADQFYTMYGNTVGGVFAVSGFMQGNGKSSNGSFSSTDVRDFTSSGTLIFGVISASYNPGVSFNGTITEGSSTASFTGSPIPSSLYNYNAAPNLGEIVGSWNLTSIRGFANVINISATGAFTGTSGSCSFSGTIKPRASGKNVFDVAITFGAAPCVLPGQSTSGIGLQYPLANGKRQLIIAGTDAARTNGAAFFGTR